MRKNNATKKRAQKRDKVSYPHSVLLNEKFENILQYLVSKGYKFTDIVKNSLENLFEVEIAKKQREVIGDDEV